ncbi:MAG TPA: hypothetical protein ENK70_01140 [Methylophaga sp.]|nr:hypothetical protein [Methylophaga sp.]
MLEKVEGHKAYNKDVKTANIVNVDDSAYNARLKIKERANRFDKLEDDITEIKHLLDAIITRINI